MVTEVGSVHPTGMQGGMHDEGEACMAGDVHDRSWACMSRGHACRRDGHCFICQC